jgi:hypothetical protein
MYTLRPCGARLLPALLAFAVATCSQAIAGQQVLVTINPNNFAAGQNISNATPGAKLLVTTAVPTADPNAPYDQAYVLRYSPSVYAQPVDPSCQYFIPVEGGSVAPCTLGGSLTIGYSAGTVPVVYPDTWAAAYAVGNCLQVMCYAEDGDQIDQVLRVNFSAPTDRVGAVIPFIDSAWGWIQAFDSAGRYLGVCYGFPGMSQPPPGCTASWVSTVVDGEGVWVQYTFASAADISFVIVGGQEIPALPIAQVQFDSPVPIQLAGLSSKVKGVAPGTSLAIEALTAQAHYDAHDIQATCAVLTGFVKQVEALAGKRIASLTAVQLLSIAIPIENAIGCLEREPISSSRDARFARPPRNQRTQ